MREVQKPMVIKQKTSKIWKELSDSVVEKEIKKTKEMIEDQQMGEGDATNEYCDSDQE
jgi:hypothetical protein